MSITPTTTSPTTSSATTCRRTLATPRSPESNHVSEIVAFVDEGLGNSSYLLDLGDGRALVVDPARDATPYLVAAERAGLSIAYTVETHLHERIMCLPDDVAVYPTHGAGSFCAAPASGERITTIGRERAANPLLAAPDEDTFVARLLDGYSTYPPYFLRLRERNRLGPPVLGSPFPLLAPLDAGALGRQLDAGAVIVDARPVLSWAAGHIHGAVAIPLRPQFGSWLGWLVADDRPLVFVLDLGQDAEELVRQARTIGYEKLVGSTVGAVDAWQAAGLPVATTELLDARSLDRPVIDVRQASEHALGHIPNSLHVELGDIARRATPVPTGALAVMCAHGERAASAASLLERAGRSDVAVVIGGPDAWAAGGAKLAAGS